MYVSVILFDYLVKKAEETTSLTWIVLATGPLLDWVSQHDVLAAG